MAPSEFDAKKSLESNHRRFVPPKNYRQGLAPVSLPPIAFLIDVNQLTFNQYVGMNESAIWDIRA
jgi:hypothetical protein